MDTPRVPVGDLRRFVLNADYSIGMAQSAPPPLANDAAGHTVTALPDGRELLIGGVADRRVIATVSIRDPQTGLLTEVSKLRQARAWHTATMLPDGRVLILGGASISGVAVAQAELFDPATNAFEVMPELTWPARAAHTATLVDGHQMVLAGGMVDGEPVGNVDVLDLDQWLVRRLGALSPARAYHTATLTADGHIVLWGGRGSDPGVTTSGAVIDLAGATLTEIFVPEPDEQFLWLAASDPSDSAIVEVPQRISLRLSRPARIETLNARTVTLAGPSGNVDLHVVPTEQGRLAFLTPAKALEPNTTYLVTVNGARDAANQPFPLLSVTFSTTDRTAPTTQPSDDEVWDPRIDNAGQTWRRNRPESQWQKLPPLMARPGLTAVSGQVLRLNGSPLPGVTLRLEDRSATTDSTGRFLLVNDEATTAWHELWIDGRKAKSRGATYGTFETAVWTAADVTTVLPFTIWMPALDTANAVKIQSPTTTETVVTTPLIPGLELRLPAGTVITDEEGKIVREVGITPIPVDQPPFPLPAGVDVPIYFTIQPGGAYVTVAGGSGYRRGARLIYPNYRNRPPGASMEFWHYEPEDGRGWYVYGLGAVSPDGRQVVPNPGVSIYEFTGAMVAPTSLPPGQGPAPGDPGQDGDPVHLGTGLFVLTKTDLDLPGVVPIGITRTYRQNDSRSRSFGIGATHQFDIFLAGDTSAYTYTDLILPDGGRVHYNRISSGTSFSNAVYEHTSSPTAFFKSRIAWNGSGWNLDLKDGSRITFPDSENISRPAQGGARSIRDRYGNTISLTRDSNGNLTRVTSPSGRWIELTYDTAHRVTQAKDNIGRTVVYTYDTSGRLWKVANPATGVTEYTYDTSHRMLTLKDPRGIVFLTNQYDGNGRVIQQTQADSTTYQFAYTLDAMGRVTQTDVTNPRTRVRRAVYDAASGYLTSDTHALGTAVARTTSFTRNSSTNQVTRATDGLGRHTDYAYDTLGNVTGVTRLASTGSAVTTNYTYDAAFSLLTSITDPLNHTTAFTRDGLGNVTTITDPLSDQTTLTYNGAGQPVTVTTPAGTTQFTYVGGDLVAISDPLGRTSSQFIDAVGRLVRTTNPLGQTTTHVYDALNAVTKTIDALSGETTFTYDANRNLLTLTDARSNTTTYTYNTMDRVVTRTDPLTRGESYVYDANGNLQQVTDRKTQVTAYTYDALDRLSTVTYHDSSTTTHTYDAGDRLTQVVDSSAGTIMRSWDLLDRLTQEATPEGTVGYTYDSADRRATMTVAGQPQVSYDYDNADRLTSIAQSSSTVGFTYDSANRRTVLTLPNGVTVEYDYDAASQVTGLTYKLGANALGNLTYTYDVAGQRTAVGGSWARTGLPTALTSATYDAANQIATWSGTSFTYDANGNLTSDGSKTYTWNARNELSALSGGVTASFRYDGLGRRYAKTIGGATTGFLYDGLNTVQELTGSTPSANLLPGLDLDEVFTRADGGGTAQFLSDALGSTVALVDGAGAVQTQYTYQPFGATTTTGSASTNSLHFTGRENDGTGLYYYRARYQHPMLQRFVSEDPIEFAGKDINLYNYVWNNPLAYSDPTGLGVGKICSRIATYFKGKLRILVLLCELAAREEGPRPKLPPDLPKPTPKSGPKIPGKPALLPPWCKPPASGASRKSEPCEPIETMEAGL